MRGTVMKKRNRLFALLLALAMVITYMPAMAFAEDGGTDGDGNADEATVNLSASESDTVQKLSFRISNNSGDVIKVIGILNGTPYSDNLISGNHKTYSLDSLSEIRAASAIDITGSDPGHEVVTYDDANFKYGLKFTSAFTADASISVIADANYSVISFDANGGSGSMEAQVGRTGQEVKLSKNTFTKNGCIFIGWATTKTGEVKFKDEQSLTLASSGTLYAIWHQHDWIVPATTGDKVTIECKEDGCPFGKIDVKLDAADTTYDGTQYDGVTITNSDSLPEGFELTEVEIYKGEELLETAPVNAGEDYKAKTELKLNDMTVGTLIDSFIISKRTLDVKADNQSKAYKAPDPELTYTVKGLADGDDESKVLSGKLTRAEGEDTGNYAITQGTLEANDNYIIEFTEGTLTIGGGISVVTKAPEAIEGLVFIGKNQNLITAGEAEGGTLYYSKKENPSEDYNTSDWTTTVPKGYNAKDFTVWYRVVGDKNHTDVPPQKVEGVSIAPMEVDIEWSTDTLIYNGKNQQPDAWAVDSEGKKITDANVSVTVENGGKNADLYRATASVGNSNYKLKAKTEKNHFFTIYSKLVTLTWAEEQSFTYNGKAVSLADPAIEGVLEGDECSVKSYSYTRYDSEEDRDNDVNGVSADEAVEAGFYKAYPIFDNRNYAALDFSKSPAEAHKYNFTIAKAEITPRVTIKGWTYGETPNEPQLAEGSNPGGGKVEYKYYIDGSWSDYPPTDAGNDYIVRARVAATDNYQGGEAFMNFNIGKAKLSDFAVTIDGWTYKETAKDPVVTGNEGKGEVSFTYYKKASADAESGTEVTGVPNAAGYYYVTASVGETANYQSAEARADFVIAKADIDFTAPAAKTDLTYDGKDQVLINAGKVNNTSLKMKYSLKADSEFTEDIETITGKDAGNYAVWYKVDGNGLYEDTGVMGPVNVTIEKAVPSYTKMPAAVKGLVYDGEEHALITAGESSEGHFEYSLLPTFYSKNVPALTNAGKYSVYVKLVGDDNHKDKYFNNISAEIGKADLVTKVTISNWREGEEASEPELTFNPENAAVTYRYKEYGTSDKTLVEDPPEEAGHYTVVAETEETANYKAASAKAFFYVAGAPEAPKANEGLTYKGEDIELIAAGDAKGTGTMMYSLDGEEYTGNASEITGRNAGAYTVWYYVNGENGYSDTKPAEVTAVIAKADADYKAPEAKKLTYTGEPQELVTAGSVSGGSMMYNLNGGFYSRYIPTATEPGEYEVGYKVDGDRNHTDVYKWLTVTIEKADVFAVVSMDGWTYDEAPSVPSVSCYLDGSDPEEDSPVEIDEENVTYEYSADGEEYSEDVPDQAGKYYVRATFEGDDHFNDAVATTQFTIKKADINPRVYITGWREGEPQRLPVVYGNKGDAEVSYLYAEVGTEDYVETAPVLEGQYLVKAVVGGSDNYNGAESEPFVFRVYEKATDADTLPQGKEGLVYDPGEDGSGTAQALVIGGTSTTDKGYFEYCVKTTEGKPGVLAGWSKDIPERTDAGTYYVWYRYVDRSHLIPSVDTYDEPITVEIAKCPIDVQVSIYGWYYGLYSARINSPKLAGESNPGKAKVTYEYKKESDPVDKYSRTVPVLGNVGRYNVRATVAETGNYEGGTASAVFTIDRSPATAAVFFSDDLTYNGKYQNLVKSAICVGGELKYTVYTVDEDGNMTLFKKESSYKPTAMDPGLYRIYYRVEADSNHWSYGEKYMDVQIFKAGIEPEVTIEGWTYGKEANEPELAEGSNPGEADVDYIYYKYDEDGIPVELEDVPSEAGDYLVSAVIHETDKYEEGAASCDFTISRAELTVTANDSTIIYGEKPVNSGVTAEGLVDGDEDLLNEVDYKFGKRTISILPPFTEFVEYQPGDAAGEYLIVPDGIESDNYNITYVNGTMTVGKRHLTVTWPGEKKFTYDGTEHSVAPELREFYGADEDSFTIATADTEATNAGTYTAKITAIESDPADLEECYEWEGETLSCEWMIDRAELKVTVNDSEIVYGEDPVADGVTYEGFVNGEDESVLGGKITYSFDYKKYDDTGVYPIYAKGLSSDNYGFNYTSGSLTVKPRPLTFTWSKKNFTYDGASHSPEVTADTVNGDKLTAEVSGGGEKDAGSYMASVTGVSGADMKNYSFSADEPSAGSSWSIAKANLVVTANSKAITYGDAPSAAGVTYSGLAKGDSAAAFNSQIKYSFTYKKNGRPGTYKIKASGINNANYSVSYRDGDLTVSDVQSVLVAQGVASGKKRVRLTWNEQTGADSYEIYFAKCDTKKKKYAFKKAATVGAGTLSYTKKKLSKNSSYKFKVVALKGGSPIAESAVIHLVTGNVQGKYTNAKAISVSTTAVTVSRGGSAKVDVSLKKAKKKKKLLNGGHAALVRFTSSNPAVAVADGNGNIYGVDSGYCRIYAQSVNGLWQTIDVTVN